MNKAKIFFNVMGIVLVSLGVYMLGRAFKYYIYFGMIYEVKLLFLSVILQVIISVTYLILLEKKKKQ